MTTEDKTRNTLKLELGPGDVDMLRHVLRTAHLDNRGRATHMRVLSGDQSSGDGYDATATWCEKLLGSLRLHAKHPKVTATAAQTPSPGETVSAISATHASTSGITRESPSFAPARREIGSRTRPRTGP